MINNENNDDIKNNDVNENPNSNEETQDIFNDIEANSIEDNDENQIESPKKNSNNGKNSKQLNPVNDDGKEKSLKNSKHLNLLLGIKMNLVVEIGKTRMKIDDILNLGLGSIVELDKALGEKVDILVNDKRIAKAELIAIDDNFGVRITELIEVEERLKLYLI